MFSWAFNASYKGQRPTNAPTFFQNLLWIARPNLVEGKKINMINISSVLSMFSQYMLKTREMLIMLILLILVFQQGG